MDLWAIGFADRLRFPRFAAQSGEMLAFAESARGISPRAAHRTGRKPLDLSGSCHPLKAAAFRQDLRLLRFPVGRLVLTRVTPSLRSVGITPLHRYYRGVRPSAPHRYSYLTVYTACASPFTSERLVPAVPRKSLCPTPAPCTPAAVRPVIRLPTD